MPPEKTAATRTAPIRTSRRDDGNAFIRDPGGGEAHTDDTLAEGLAETFLESATSGEAHGEEVMNALVSEELGGPFIEEEMSYIEGSEEPVAPSRRRRRASAPGPARKPRAAGRTR